jgi:hypothetical protein
MSNAASNEKPLDVPVSPGKQEAGIFIRDVVAIRRFQVNDMVRIIAEGQQEYVVLAHRDHELCGQIQKTDGGLKRREWMISQELELVSDTANNIPHISKDAPSGLPRTHAS